MTLWNPLNVFSGRTHSAADGPSASFDPSRTGDPLGPRPTDPAIGIGGTQIGGPVEHGRSAPPSDRLRAAGRAGRRAAVPHGDLLPAPPRAAARERDAGVPGGRRAARLAEPGAGRLGRRRSGRRRRRRSTRRVACRSVEESVPFFKREISFRRKKAAAARGGRRRGDPDDVVDGAVDEPFDDVDAADEVTEPTDEWEIPAVEVVAAV